MLVSLYLLVLVCLATSSPAHDLQAFDYVIVGGGTAGLVLANRLSEDPRCYVAVLEAGGETEMASPVLSTVPSFDSVGVGADPSDTNSIDWNFVTAPQAALNGRTLHYARGKCLGGSSVRNFMVYQRPNSGAMDKWANAVGDDTYRFRNMLPYYKKSVRFTPPKGQHRATNATACYDETAFSWTGSPLRVSYPNYAQPWSSWLQLSMAEAGLSSIEDFNSGALLGTQYCAQTINPTHETRDSSETSFLAAASSRPNLHVFTQTLVKRITFDGTRATGVIADGKSGSFAVKAEGEVIMSAGTFQSPQLLMASGVGPAPILNDLGIRVVANRSGVGQNLQDHVFFGPSYRVNLVTATIDSIDPNYVLSQLNGPYAEGLGQLTNNLCDFLGFEKLPQPYRNRLSAEALASYNRLPEDWPELEGSFWRSAHHQKMLTFVQFIAAPGYVGDFSNLATNQPRDGYQYASVLAALVAPLSRGNVTIISRDTSDPPVIDPGFLTSPIDRELAVQAYRRARAFFETRFIKDILIGPEYYPGAAVQSDEEVLEVIRKDAMTVWHASGTCAMGRIDDDHAVVDSYAKVIGVDGLRIVDASIFPFLPPGHPQATVYALAEKIAEMIRSGN